MSISDTPPPELLFSEACERNKHPILGILRQVLEDGDQVLEVGSGTGQHACFFAEHLPHANWQPSDCPTDKQSWYSLQNRIAASQLSNLLPPLKLDISSTDPANILTSTAKYTAAFTANTLHIMPWPVVEQLFNFFGEVFLNDGKLLIYGPFNYKGNYSSDSNRQFDHWLKARDQAMGIRNIEAVIQLAENNGLQLLADHEMPANNRLLHFTRRQA